MFFLLTPPARPASCVAHPPRPAALPAFRSLLVARQDGSPMCHVLHPPNGQPALGRRGLAAAPMSLLECCLAHPKAAPIWRDPEDSLLSVSRKKDRGYGEDTPLTHAEPQREPLSLPGAWAMLTTWSTSSSNVLYPFAFGVLGASDQCGCGPKCYRNFTNGFL